MAICYKPAKHDQVKVNNQLITKEIGVIKGAECPSLEIFVKSGLLIREDLIEKAPEPVKAEEAEVKEETIAKIECVEEEKEEKKQELKEEKPRRRRRRPNK